MMSIDPLEGEDFVVECEGHVIGKAGFYRFPEIGYILHPDAWGQGYAREALGPVLARAFSRGTGLVMSYGKRYVSAC